MGSKDIAVREEEERDRDGVRSVLIAAFGGNLEADLVDRLRETCTDHVSLVADDGGAVVGHILFTPAKLESRGRTVTGWGLAPMAVRPEFQRRKIGTLLVEAGLSVLRVGQGAFVAVLGHPLYYPRFGFQPEGLWKLRSEWDVPDEAFMILPLNREVLGGVEGVVRYRPEFQRAMKGETS